MLNESTPQWVESVQEYRAGLERIADADLPISDDVRILLAEADSIEVATG